MEYVYLEGDKIKVSNSAGYVLTVTGQGDTVKEAGDNTEKLLKKLVIPKGFWRNDFGAHYFEGKKELIKLGYLEDDTTQEEALKQKEESDKQSKLRSEMEKGIKEDYEKKLDGIKKAVKKIIYEPEKGEA